MSSRSSGVTKVLQSSSVMVCRIRFSFRRVWMNWSSVLFGEAPAAMVFKYWEKSSTLALASSAPASRRSKNLSSLPKSFFSKFMKREASKVVVPRVTIAKQIEFFAVSSG